MLMGQNKDIQNKLSRIYHSYFECYLDAPVVLKSLTVQESGSVVLIFNEPPGSTQINQLKSAIEAAIFELDWVKELDIQLSIFNGQTLKRDHGLSNVQHIIAVSSCKGGVGKSTMALNIATALQMNNASVGLFDADIHGPSLPTLLTPTAIADTPDENRLPPFLNHHLKLMSYGYIQDQVNQPAILRGPIASNMLKQMLLNTDWGYLDYLIIDCPPGTGDILLTLTQELALTTSVVITTPHELSYVDVKKGIEMFNKVKVPTFGIVENMSYFTPPDSTEKYHIFGHGRLIPTAKECNIPHWFEVPITQDLASYNNKTVPYLMSQPNEETKDMFLSLANKLAWYCVQHTHHVPCTLVHDNATENVTVTQLEGASQDVSYMDLRDTCKCALCVDEITGKKVFDRSKIKDLSINKTFDIGHYGVGVEWQDKHQSMYTFNDLETFLSVSA
jgi:ATP-binding protein involved in chromosome partitioning